MIPGDHQWSNPSGFGFCDGILRLLPRRIDHANQPGEDEVLFHARVRSGRVRGEHVGRHPKGRYTKRAQRLACECFVRL